MGRPLAMKLAFILFTLLLCAGCGGGTKSTQPTVLITPGSATVQAGATQQFTTGTTGVTWSVNGAVGGSSTTGSISSTGLYTAPSSVPTNPVVTITAQTSSVSGTATVTISTGSITSFQGQQWEFALTSDNSAWTTTLVEAAMNQSGNQLTASGVGSETQTVQVNNGVWNFPQQMQGDVSGTISGTALSLTFSSQTTISAQGTIGQGVITGTWQSGTFTGELSGHLVSKPVSSLTATYAGTVNIVGNYCDPTPNCTLMQTGQTQAVMPFTPQTCSNDGGVYCGGGGTGMTLGGEEASFGGQFSGYAAGNAAQVTFQEGYASVNGAAYGTAYSVVLYYDQTGKYTGTPNSIAVMDVFDNNGSGLLVLQ